MGFNNIWSLEPVSQTFITLSNGSGSFIRSGLSHGGEKLIVNSFKAERLPTVPIICSLYCEEKSLNSLGSLADSFKTPVVGSNDVDAKFDAYEHKSGAPPSEVGLNCLQLKSIVQYSGSIV